MRKALLLVTFLGWALFAAGQQGYELLRADIPFDFQINGQPLPSGVYLFGSNVEKHVISVQSMNSVRQIKYVQMVNFDDFRKPTGAFVLFTRIGNQYFFKALQHPGWGSTSVFPSAIEERYKKLAKQQVEVKGDEVGK